MNEPAGKGLPLVGERKIDVEMAPPEDTRTEAQSPFQFDTTLNKDQLNLQCYRELQQEALERAKQDLESRMPTTETQGESLSKSGKKRGRRHRGRGRGAKDDESPKSQHPASPHLPPLPPSEIPFGRGPHEDNWRANMMDNMHRQPKDQPPRHFERWLRIQSQKGRNPPNESVNAGVMSQYLAAPTDSVMQTFPEDCAKTMHHQVVHQYLGSTAAPTAPAMPFRNTMAATGYGVDEYLGEPDPHGQVAAWEFWALWRLLRHHTGLSDQEIGFFLDLSRDEAMKRWA